MGGLFKGQTAFYIGGIGRGNSFVASEGTLAFGRLLAQNMGGMRIAALQIARPSFFKTLGRGLVGSDFGHAYLSLEKIIGKSEYRLH